MSPEERYYANSDEGEIKRLRERLEQAAEREARHLTENQQQRSLLECTAFALEWFFDRFDNPKFFQCDCSDDRGYMEYDTNAYIHTERCSSGMGDSMGALRDQIRQTLGRRFHPATGAEGDERGTTED